MIIINLHNIKWKRKITQEELAKASFLNPVTINKLMSHEPHNFTIKTLEKICKYFGCSVHEIIEEIPD